MSDAITDLQTRLLQERLAIAQETRGGLSGGRTPLFAIGADGKSHFAGSTSGAGKSGPSSPKPFDHSPAALAKGARDRASKSAQYAKDSHARGDHQTAKIHEDNAKASLKLANDIERDHGIKSSKSSSSKTKASGAKTKSSGQKIPVKASTKKPSSKTPSGKKSGKSTGKKSAKPANHASKALAALTKMLIEQTKALITKGTQSSRIDVAEQIRSLQERLTIAETQRSGLSGGRTPLFAMGADGRMHFAGSTAGSGLHDAAIPNAKGSAHMMAEHFASGKSGGAHAPLSDKLQSLHDALAKIQTEHAQTLAEHPTAAKHLESARKSAAGEVKTPSLSMRRPGITANSDTKPLNDMAVNGRIDPVAAYQRFGSDGLRAMLYAMPTGVLEDMMSHPDLPSGVANLPAQSHTKISLANALVDHLDKIVGGGAKLTSIGTPQYTPTHYVEHLSLNIATPPNGEAMRYAYGNEQYKQMIAYDSHEKLKDVAYDFGAKVGKTRAETLQNIYAKIDSTPARVPSPDARGMDKGPLHRPSGGAKVSGGTKSSAGSTQIAALHETSARLQQAQGLPAEVRPSANGDLPKPVQMMSVHDINPYGTPDLGLLTRSYGEHQVGSVLSTFTTSTLKELADANNVATAGNNRVALVSALTAHTTQGRYSANFGTATKATVPSTSTKSDTASMKASLAGYSLSDLQSMASGQGIQTEGLSKARLITAIIKKSSSPQRNVAAEIIRLCTSLAFYQHTA